MDIEVGSWLIHKFGEVFQVKRIQDDFVLGGGRFYLISECFPYSGAEPLNDEELALLKTMAVMAVEDWDSSILGMFNPLLPQHKFQLWDSLSDKVRAGLTLLGMEVAAV